MKATIQIPKGWRRLRVGEVIRKGDRYLDNIESDWLLFCYGIGTRLIECRFPSIRRIARPRKP